MNLAVHVPYASEPVLVSPGHDHTFALRVEALRCNAAGIVIAQLKGDAAPRRFDVAAGEVIAGLFVKVCYELDPTADVEHRVSTTLVGAHDLLGLAYTAQPAH